MRRIDFLTKFYLILMLTCQFAFQVFANDGRLFNLPGLSDVGTFEHLQKSEPDSFLKNSDTGGNESVSFNQKLIPGNVSVVSAFGGPVAISGDTAVVGAIQDQIGRNKKQGSVHVFVQRKGVWIQQAKLIAADGRRGDQFGYSLAIDGDTLVVGMPLAFIGKDKDQGAAYVFTRRGDNWEKQVKLVASGGSESHAFGSSVGISGDTIIVGAPGVDNFPDDKIPQAHGAAYIFTRNNNEWTEKQKITGDSKSTAGFGFNVAIDNKTAAIGGASDKSGDAIYIFSDSGTGWKKEQKIISSRFASERAAGFSASSNLAIDGNTLIAGGSQGEKSKNGAVFVYIRDGGKWTQQAKLSPSDQVEKDTFGWSADISGDRIIVGEFSPAKPDRGTVYLFGRKVTENKTVWVEQNVINAPGDELIHFFGGNVGISGDKILIGSSEVRYGKQRNKGAYVYQIGAPTP